ncbi:MAG: nucleotidyltransferase domain-containing protein [Armatimonadota bacterium]
MPQLLSLLEYHGLTPLLWHCASDACDLLPEEARAQFHVRLLGLAARNAVAIHQLEELARAFSEAGIPVIALKGAAAVLWLYDDIACRVITDLDLLVPERHIDAAARTLEELGYSNKPAKSPEVARAAVLEKLDHGEHLSPYFRPGSFSIELHSNFLKRRQNLHLVPDEIWSRAVPASPDVPGLLRLSAMDFLLHAAVHYPQHIETGIPPLKFLIDMALAVRKCSDEIEWELFWSTAERWGICGTAEAMMATIAHHFQLDVPGLPPNSLCLDADALLNGAFPLWARNIMAETLLPGSEELTVAKTLGGYWQSITKAQRLSGWGERLRYLFHLVFPQPAYMRHRYKVPDGRSVAPYYLIHPFVLVRNFAVGLLTAVRRERLGKPRSSPSAAHSPTRRQESKDACATRRSVT